MNQTLLNPAQSSNDEIGQLAYSIWEEEGRPDGRSLEHWLMAENRLRTQKEFITSPYGRNEQSSVVAPAEPSVGPSVGTDISGSPAELNENTRGSKSELPSKRQSGSRLAPANNIGKAA
jgi:hypothetical protein